MGNTKVTTPVVKDIISWVEENDEAATAVAPVTVPVTTLTWVQAATRVLPADGEEMHIDDIMKGIKEANLRDTTSVKTPMQTLRRDLNVESRRSTARVKNTRRGWYAKA